MKPIPVLTFLMVLVCMVFLICNRGGYHKDPKTQRMETILKYYSLTDSTSRQISRELIKKIIETE